LVSEKTPINYLQTFKEETVKRKEELKRHNKGEVFDVLRALANAASNADKLSENVYMNHGGSSKLKRSKNKR
jgi:hypothetical protein